MALITSLVLAGKAAQPAAGQDAAPANKVLRRALQVGDYMWVAIGDKGRANVVWTDTRGLNGTVEEDIYFATAR
jgi:hypothetical protein